MISVLILLGMSALVGVVYGIVCNQARGGSNCECGHMHLGHLPGTGCAACECQVVWVTA